MKVLFKPSFVKDFKKLPSVFRREVRSICTEIFPKLHNIRDFQGHHIKAISGFRDYYRIRLDGYRIGFKKRKDGSVEFMRAKHRKDIYRNFP